MRLEIFAVTSSGKVPVRRGSRYGASFSKVNGGCSFSTSWQRWKYCGLIPSITAACSRVSAGA
jgi:hypothetical protein